MSIKHRLTTLERKAGYGTDPLIVMIPEFGGDGCIAVVVGQSGACDTLSKRSDETDEAFRERADQIAKGVAA